jgi:hypothetical protein
MWEIDSAWQYDTSTKLLTMRLLIAELLLNELDDMTSIKGKQPPSKYYILYPKSKTGIQNPLFFQGAYSILSTGTVRVLLGYDMDKLREPIGDHRINLFYGRINTWPTILHYVRLAFMAPQFLDDKKYSCLILLRVSLLTTFSTLSLA